MITHLPRTSLNLAAQANLVHLKKPLVTYDRCTEILGRRAGFIDKYDPLFMRRSAAQSHSTHPGDFVSCRVKEDLQLGTV